MEPNCKDAQKDARAGGRNNSSGASVEDYPLLLAMLADWPRLLPKQTINMEVGHLHPQLAVWSISGKAFAVKAFRTKLQNWSLAHGDQKLTNLTTHSLGDGIAGVVSGAQIHFQDLWVK